MINLVSAGFLVFLALGIDACMRSQAYVKLGCPVDNEITAQPRQYSAQVVWSRADFTIQSTHTVKGLYQTVPIYGASSQVKRLFQEGRHYVEYKAVDESGNFDSCSFSVTVKVIRCLSLYNPQFSILSCDASNLYGSQCHISCIGGYSIVGQKSITCTKDGHWSDDIPFCRPTTCPDPGTPIHGTRVCTTATHAYGSICNFFCEPGHQIVGNSRLICHSNEDNTFWSSDTPTCKEITAPKVEVCPSDIKLTSGEALTEVQRPRIVFRTEQGHEAPYRCTYFGQKESYNFTMGKHHVTCRAFDPDFGDRAIVNCKFTVHIKANPCRALQQPLNGLLLCSRAHGGGSSLHDTNCRLFCDKGYALPRMDQEDTNEYQCDNTGAWQPSSYVPSCVRPIRPQEIILPSEILYTSSNCSNAHHLKQLRVKFQSEVQSTIRMQQACESSPGDCIVEEVNTGCHSGNPARHFLRTRTQTHPLSKGGIRRRNYWNMMDQDYIVPVQFHFATRIPETGGDWPDEYHKALLRLYGMFDYYEQQVLSGEFRISGRVPELNLREMEHSLTMAPTKVICDHSYKFNPDILLCVACGPGSYFNIRKSRCELCPVGKYQNEEAQLTCKSCPLGKTTLDLGTTNLTQCIDVDECAYNPCLHNGQCINGIASYTCQCAPGYSGSHCADKVYDCTIHACQNGGTCVPINEHNYTCQCSFSYWGDCCQFHTIHGGWSEWSEWSKCSKSCETGYMTRTRVCNNPRPTHGGNDCEGATLLERVCNTHDCPVCRNLRRPYQGSIKCTRNEEEDITSCVIGCPKGYAFSGHVFPVYTCGPNTSYLWPHQSPDNPRCVLPACTQITQADEARYEFRSQLHVGCPSVAKRSIIIEQVRERAAEITANLACLRDGTCTLNEPQITGCNGRYRRAVPVPEVDVTVSLTYFGSNTLNKAGGMEFSESPPGLMDLGERLLDTAKSGDLYIELDGERLMIEPNQTLATNRLVCPKGKTEAFGGRFCVDCSLGTFYHEGSQTCILCDTGYYQPEEAQLSCIRCPDNYTTWGRGTIFAFECYENGTKPPSIPDEYYEKKGEDLSSINKPILVAVLVGSLVVIVTAVIITAAICKNRYSKKYNVVRRQRQAPEGQPAKEITVCKTEKQHEQEMTLYNTDGKCEKEDLMSNKFEDQCANNVTAYKMEDDT